VRGVPAKTRKITRAGKKGRKKAWFTLPALYSDYPVYKVKTLTVGGDAAAAACFTPPGDRRCIKLREGKLTLDQQRVVLWHEAFHAIFAEAGLEANFEDEALCEMLSQAVMQIRKKVPWL
jgi:hypothetical protein